MRNFWLVLVAAAGIAGLLMLSRGGDREGWTSESPEAIAEYELCLDADMKVYRGEAFAHCKRAAEIDPDFVVAKLRVIRGLGHQQREHREHRERLIEEVRAADLDRVSDRERFLVEYFLARVDDKIDLADAIVDEYLDQRPEDPFALRYLCGGFWDRQQWAEAKPCYERLLEADPNWVSAWNNLGYMAMAQGKFKEAEELFEAYLFIAPDQSNPLDSLGELLSLIGRYEDAQESFREAIRIRPDFCSSYDHLISVHLMQEDYAAARSVLELMNQDGTCGNRLAVILKCQISMWRPIVAEDWDGAWAVAENGCRANAGDILVLTHLSAVMSGRAPEALAIERTLDTEIGRAEEGRWDEIDQMRAIFFHLQGIRAAADGDIEGAADKFALADSKLKYWHVGGLGVFKLYNRLNLANALRRKGELGRARGIEDKVRSVNPRFHARFGPLLGSGGHSRGNAEETEI